MPEEHDNLDEQLDQAGRRKNIKLWLIIGLIAAVVIAVPMIVLRQSETEATEPTTIEQIEAEIDALYLTVYGTEATKGLETKLAEQAELISKIDPLQLEDTGDLLSQHPVLEQVDIDPQTDLLETGDQCFPFDHPSTLPNPRNRDNQDLVASHWEYPSLVIR